MFEPIRMRLDRLTSGSVQFRGSLQPYSELIYLTPDSNPLFYICYLGTSLDALGKH